MALVLYSAWFVLVFFGLAMTGIGGVMMVLRKGCMAGVSEAITWIFRTGLILIGLVVITWFIWRPQETIYSPDGPNAYDMTKVLSGITVDKETSGEKECVECYSFGTLEYYIYRNPELNSEPTVLHSEWLADNTDTEE